MMRWKDARVQLIDTPPVTADFMEGYLCSMVGAADGAVRMIDLADDDGRFAAEAVLERLKEVKTVLIGTPPAPTKGTVPLSSRGQSPLSGPTDTPDPTIHFTRTLIAANKLDAPGAGERLEIAREMYAARFSIVALDAASGNCLEELRTAIYKMLNVIRVYS